MFQTTNQYIKEIYNEYFPKSHGSSVGLTRLVKSGSAGGQARKAPGASSFQKNALQTPYLQRYSQLPDPGLEPTGLQGGFLGVSKCF